MKDCCQWTLDFYKLMPITFKLEGASQSQRAKKLRWTARGRTWSSPKCSVRQIQCKKDRIQVSYVEKNMVQWNSLALFLIVNLLGVIKPYLGPDLIDPQSSSGFNNISNLIINGCMVLVCLCVSTVSHNLQGNSQHHS